VRSEASQEDSERGRGSRSSHERTKGSVVVSDLRENAKTPLGGRLTAVRLRSSGTGQREICAKLGFLAEFPQRAHFCRRGDIFLSLPLSFAHTVS